MQRLRNVLLVCVSALLCSCAKAPLTNGDTVSRTDTVDGRFGVVMLYDNVDVILRHCDGDHSPGSYRITTGKNLIDNIKVENPVRKINGKDSLMTDTVMIHNYNRLNWIRPYDYELKLELYYKSISEIVFNSNGMLETDAIQGVAKGETTPKGDGKTDSGIIKLTVEGGSGDVKLRVDCFQLDTEYAFGTAKVYLSGTSPIANTNCGYDSHGPVDARGLWTNYHFIHHYGTNYVKAFAKHEISAHNYNNGVIQYVADTVLHLPETLDTSGMNIIPLMQ